jgi:general secretion pathway protein K
MTLARAKSSQRGFALVVVLWNLGLLALLFVGMATAGRTGADVATNLRGNAEAQAAADGAIHLTIFRLLSGAWPTNGPPRRVTIGDATVEIAIEDQRGRINPNLSSPDLMAALLVAAGADPGLAHDLALAIVDWRTKTQVSISGGLKVDRYRAANLPYGPAGEPFASVDEIELIPGITPALSARLGPYLSVYQLGDQNFQGGGSTNRPASDDAEAIARLSALSGFTSPETVVAIHATAIAAKNARFARNALVRLSAQARPSERSWQILQWD